MENLKLIDRLKNKTNISYEEAKTVLEKSNWDILDAMLYLEEKGKVPKPSDSIFYTNEYKESYKYIDVINKNDQKNNYNNRKSGNNFEGFFEVVCKVIDTCNKILFEIKRENRIFLKIPSTVMILLLIFAFWMVIPLAIVGLFFDMEFSLSGNKAEINKINNVFKIISVNIKKVKKELKKGFKNG